VQQPDLADLIIRGLSGEHLNGWLPGNDNRAAISHVVSSKASWSGPGMGWGEVHRDGIGEWPSGTRYGDRRRSAAALFVPWAEVLAIIARGCPGGHRERYEAAFRAWGAGVAKVWEGYRPGTVPFPETPDPGEIHRTTVALIRHGCEQLEVQDALW